MLTRRQFFMAILIFWGVVIFGFILLKQTHIQNGQVYYLKTAPVDPRDIFRGNYVNLNYEISNIPISTSNQELQKMAVNLKEGDRVYVILNNRDDISDFMPVDGVYPSKWKSIQLTKPLEGNFIVGIVDNVSRFRDTTLTLTIKYGIESYFIPQEKAAEIEKARRDGEIYGKVIVNKDGQGILDALIINGKELKY